MPAPKCCMCRELPARLHSALAALLTHPLPLPPPCPPTGAAAVAWRTEVARQQLLAAALQQFAAAQQAAAAGAAPASGDASAPASPSGSAAGESAGSTPVAAVAARLAAASLECGSPGAAPSAMLRPQLPLAATCLRPFAFMPYRASGRTWVDDWNLQRQHLPMIAAAGSWVERRKVPLPDFDFYSHCYRWVQRAACGVGAGWPAACNYRLGGAVVRAGLVGMVRAPGGLHELPMHRCLL